MFEKIWVALRKMTDPPTPGILVESGRHDIIIALNSDKETQKSLRITSINALARRRESDRYTKSYSSYPSD